MASDTFRENFAKIAERGSQMLIAPLNSALKSSEMFPPRLKIHENFPATSQLWIVFSSKSRRGKIEE
jgi:hypothetical protein